MKQYVGNNQTVSVSNQIIYYTKTATSTDSNQEGGFATRVCLMSFIHLNK